MEDRKAFNFYRSFYDVAMLLPDDEKGKFLMAICHAQFTGEIVEPDTPMAKLAFTSQIHSIKKQIEGFNFGKKTPIIKTPSEGPLQGPYKEPLPQVQVQEQVKEKVKGIEERKAEFYKLLAPTVSVYGKEMVREFFDHWTEHGPKDKKMRFEKEKSFDPNKRLATWKRNEERFGNKKPSHNPLKAYGL